MKVIFHHTHAHDHERVEFDDVMQPALDEKGVHRKDENDELLYEQQNPDDVLGVNVYGDMTRRISVESPNTTVQFAPEAVELIIKERIDAKSRYPKTRRPVIAELLSTGAAAERFHTEHVTDITIEPPDDDLREYLLDHFGVTPQTKTSKRKATSSEETP